MKIACDTCGEVLTPEELVYDKNYGERFVNFDVDIGYADYEYFITAGTYMINERVFVSYSYPPTKNGTFSLEGFDPVEIVEEYYSFALEDLNVLVEEYKSGMGCCNVVYGDVWCPNCFEIVGEANLDCYQTKQICLDFEEIKEIIL